MASHVSRRTRARRPGGGVAAARSGRWPRWPVLTATSLALLSQVACTGAQPPAQSQQRTAAASSAAGSASQSTCSSAVRTGPLPTWARGGFDPPDQTQRFVQGAGGEIVGVVFGYPLQVPSSADRDNKVLWIAKQPAGSGPMTITGALEGTTRSFTQELAGGPGPSIVDVPAPGCWRLTLAWSGATDTVSLPYRPG